MSPLRIAGLLALFTACAVSEGPEIGLAFMDEPPDEDEPCPPNGCGGNSPVVEGVYFGRLSSLGLENAEGVKITKVVSGNGVAMTLHAVNDRLQGRVINSTAIVEHGALTQTQIHIDTNGTPGIITISSVLMTGENFWVGSKAMIESYEFRYLSMANGGAEVDGPLCSEGDNDPNKIAALVFAGDLYDPITKAITTGPATNNWFNIACVYSATYKMHKIGYTTAAKNQLGEAYNRTLSERRAMLNAWTMNACGKGEAFTHEGEPITLRESHDLLPIQSPYSQPSATIEAIWGPNGAVCLNTHRLAEENPDILKAIANAPGCDGALPPSCDNMVNAWSSYGYVLTGNPVGE